MRRKVTLTIEVGYDDDHTDSDALAYALDTLMNTATSTPGILAEYGDVTIGEFFPPQTNALSEMSYEDLLANAVLIELRAPSYRHDASAMACLHEDRLKYRAEAVRKGWPEDKFKEDVRIEYERRQKLESQVDD